MRACVLGALGVVGLALASLPAQAQAKGGTAVSRQIVARFPCPAPIPAAWGVADSTLASQPRCALVAAAVVAFNRSIARSPRLRRVAWRKVACTSVQRMTFRDPQTDRVVSDKWLVTFYSDSQPDVSVALDPQTGTGRASPSLKEFGYTAREICVRLPNDR